MNVVEVVRANVASRSLSAPSLTILVSLALAALTVGGCRDESEPPQVPAVERSPDAGPARAAEAPPPTAFGCIRGGTSRAEVLELMGEPDSVSYGVWLYGASEVAFGYGVVVDYSDEDGVLALCRDRAQGGSPPAGGAAPPR